MSRLEEIFKEPETEQRVALLLDYARSLKLSVVSAKKEDGSYSENILAVMLFNAESSKKTQRFQNVATLFIGIFFTAAVFLAIILLVYMVQNEPIIPVNVELIPQQ